MTVKDMEKALQVEVDIIQSSGQELVDIMIKN